MTYVITGGNRGMGFHTALKLARMDREAIIVCRNQKTGKIAQQKIRLQSGGRLVRYLVADLATQSSVRALADQLSNHSPIKVLINNAAVLTTSHSLTKDDIETQFAVNYLAPFLLTNLLLSNGQISQPGRIVNVSSSAHQKANIDLENLQQSTPYFYRSVYAQTKLALLLFSYELARRLSRTSISVNSIHPGMVSTPMLASYIGLPDKLSWLTRFFSISPDKAADALCFLATDANLEDVSGKYFIGKKVARSSAASNDTTMAKELWEASHALVDL